MAEVNCFGKTENYSDKITLLNTYDTNDNGRIDTMELQQAIADWNVGKITVGERDIVEGCWKLGEDGISKFCRRRPPCGDYGDVDGDGWVSVKDVVYTMRHTIFLSEYPMTPDQKRRADVNGDGKVTAADALIIAKYIVGQYDTFAVCTKVPPTDPCAGVTCPNGCYGTSLYSKKCVDGHCVKDALIKSNAPECGYVAPPPPAKGNVHNLDYPANAKNGETITIKASVANVGGTSGDFSLRVIAAPQIPLVTHRVGIVSAYKFTAPVNLQVTMPSSGTVANLGVQCIRHI